MLISSPSGSSLPGLGLLDSGTSRRIPDHPDRDDRHVDQEPEAPPEVLQQETSSSGPSATAPRPGPPTARSPTSFVRREHDGDDRQGHGQDGGTTDTHQPTRDDQLHRIGRECAERRGQPDSTRPMTRIFLRP